jgi:predicted RecB family nuclease
MQLEGDELRLSATDLAGHLGCAHLTGLEGLAARRRARRPDLRRPMLDLLIQRGLAHERAYLDFLRNEQGVANLVTIPELGSEAALREATLTAMRAGAGAIAQAALGEGRWRGRADVLRRVEQPSALGAWSYAVVDTKLASETRAGTLLQLCLYNELVSAIQDREPELMFVVTPGLYAKPQEFRTSDFTAYYRLVKRRLEELVDGEAARAASPVELATYPDPVPQCEVCRWWSDCQTRRRGDDHLCQVAGATRLQQRELRARGVDTLAKLARIPLPLEPRPARGSPESYERVHHQARLQLVAREHGPTYELLSPGAPGEGLARLPEPSPGDVFLDLEGNHFIDRGGREYLFGWIELDQAQARQLWAVDAAAERAAFEQLVDALLARWEREPGMHVYHFGHYEPSALKRLMGRHATREAQLDRLLRGQRFVDLHTVLRQGLRAGVERYGLKDLEVLHGFARAQDLREAAQHLRVVERALELRDPAAIPAATREAVAAYNREDCASTRSLRDWLEARRAELVATGAEVPRPENGTGDPPESVGEREARIGRLIEQLVLDVPAERGARSDEQQGRWLMAHLLDWHRREMKATYWEKFRLLALSADELVDEKAGLAGLEYVGRIPGGTTKCPVHRYRFPPQDHDVRPDMEAYACGDDKALGEIVALDTARGEVDIKKKQLRADLHPTALFTHRLILPHELPDALEALAETVLRHGIDAPGPARAARDLLLGRAPRGLELDPRTQSLQHAGEELADAARRMALALDGGVLPVQGPPGAGKTYLGARLICDLVRAGKKVGVTAVSHKVIRNLLDGVLEAAAESGLAVTCMHKGESSSRKAPPDGPIRSARSGADLDSALASGDVQVGGGTAWHWSRAGAADTVDVLVVDEAGQMSLANTLASARATRSSLILLGDPQQLEQPLQGSHPEGTDASALQHLLGEHDTVPAQRGLFLAETWRLHPSVCAFTSRLFYEGRLRSRQGKGLEQQRLLGPTRFAGAGLWLVPVEHEGNTSSSPEEAECVAELVAELLGADVRWCARDGVERELSADDVLIVAPYNAHVRALQERMPDLRIGTVDKFQGQEAPVVIYSMATSSPDEAPRGLDFLYDLHRLNVATSRAQAVCILVASPRLLEPDCRTPHQMRLANALCAYVEQARVAEL